MARDVWSFGLTKLDGSLLGAVPKATDRQLGLRLNGTSTGSFQVRADNPYAANLLTEDLLLKAYQNETLRFWGPVISSQLAGDGNTASVSVSAADPSWRLAKRLSGKSTGGKSFGSIDKGENAKKLIDECNTAGETGIKTVTVSSSSTGTYTAGPYKPTLTCISELAHGIDGFDWYIKPIEGTASKIGQFELDDVIGTVRSAVFEYGAGIKNMQSITFLRDLGNILNSAYIVSDEGLFGGTTINAKNTASVTARGLYEEVLDLSGVNNETLRTEWAEENVGVRGNPRKVFAMTPAPYDSSAPTKVPKFGTDYFLGDQVNARGVVNGVPLFSGVTRVYAADISIADSGTATVVPTLLNEGA